MLYIICLISKYGCWGRGTWVHSTPTSLMPVPLINALSLERDCRLAEEHLQGGTNYRHQPVSCLHWGPLCKHTQHGELARGGREVCMPAGLWSSCHHDDWSIGMEGQGFFRKHKKWRWGEGDALCVNEQCMECMELELCLGMNEKQRVYGSGLKEEWCLGR